MNDDDRYTRIGCSRQKIKALRPENLGPCVLSVCLWREQRECIDKNTNGFRLPAGPLSCASGRCLHFLQSCWSGWMSHTLERSTILNRCAFNCNFFKYHTCECPIPRHDLQPLDHALTLPGICPDLIKPLLGFAFGFRSL